MGEGVDAEGSLLDEEDTEDAGIDEATEPVAPAKAADEHGEDDTHENDDFEVVAVLPDNDGVFIKICDVGSADAFGVLFHYHPTNVGVQEAFADRVRVLICVGIAVVGTVASSPPSNGPFHSTTSNSSKIYF